MLKRLVNRALRTCGYQLVRAAPPPPPDPLEFGTVLRRVARNVPDIATVIDIGASNGSWSKRVRKVYPNAAFHLIDANPVHEAELKAFCTQAPRTTFTLAAAGDSAGEIYFDLSAPLGGVAAHEPFENAARAPMVTVDGEMSRL